MNEKNEFDILENTDQSVIDRLSAEFPPSDAEEKEKVFRMSERKFNIANTPSVKFTETDEQTVSGVDVYRRPMWKKCLSTAAAAAILIGGAAGGIKAYRHFTNVPAVTEEPQVERKIAPFGDLSELDYKLCDFDADTMQKVIIRDTPEEYSYFELFSGSDIALEKREKLAEFFNNYDYGESLTEAEQLQAVINKSLKDIDEENEAVSEGSVSSDTDHFINDTAEVPVIPENSDNTANDGIPYFIYNNGSEIRAVKIYDVGEFGVLNYTHFSYSEDNGELVMTDDEISTDAWKIDYDLFKSTITYILGSEEDKTEPAPEDSVKFPVNFTAHDFFTYDPDSKTDIEVKIGKSSDEGGDGEIGFWFKTGNIIPLEKRQQLNDLFNSYDWKEVEEHNETPDFLYTNERFGLYNLSDNNFTWCLFDRDNNTLTISSFEIELESDDHYDTTDDPNAIERYITYKGTDDSLTEEDVTKAYKIDYDLLKSKIAEILGDSFNKPAADVWSFFSQNWYMKTSESTESKELSDIDDQYLYDTLRSCKWTLDSVDSEKISTEEEAIKLYEDSPIPADSSDYIILSCNCLDVYHYVICIDSTPEKTIIRCNKYCKMDSDILGYEYQNSIYTYSCDDTSLVRKIKEYSGS